MGEEVVSHTDGGQDAYMSKWVQVVVGELEFLEGDELSHPVGSGRWGVRVHVEATGHGRFGFASYRPRWRRRELQCFPRPRGSWPEASCF